MAATSLRSIARRPVKVSRTWLGWYFNRCSTTGVSHSSRDDDGRMRVRALKSALAELKSLSPSDGRSQELQHSLPASFEVAMPDLMRSGALTKTALRLPLSHPRSEDTVKALMLLLSRRLRAQRVNLPPSELPHIPALLQRLGSTDNDVYDDFCTTCGALWVELCGSSAESAQLSTLLRGAEDYALLHPTKGTALDRVVAAIVKDLQTSPDRSAVQLASLCKAVLQLRTQSVDAPLLKEIRAQVLNRIGDCDSGHDAAVLLVAVAELNAVGESSGGPLPVEQLKRLLVIARDAMVATGSEPSSVPVFVANVRGVAACTRSCSLLWWAAPEATSEFFDAWLDRLQERVSSNPRLLDAALESGHVLPAALRLTLVERLILTTPSQSLEDTVIVNRLRLLHDLPSIASMHGNDEVGLRCVSHVDALVAEICGRGESARPTSLAWAFLAVTSGSCAPVSADTVASLQKLEKRALDALKVSWTDLAAKDIQLLFKTPSASAAAAVARIAVDNIRRTSGLAAQIAILNSLHGVCGQADFEKASAVVSKVVDCCEDRKELAMVEALIRRSSNAEVDWCKDIHAALLQRVRDRLWKITLSAEPAWCRTPARGFVRYVERCSSRGRRAWQESLAASGATAASPADAPPLSPELTLAHAVSEKVTEPTSEVQGVAWHRGMESWTVHIDVNGKKALHGYFKPRDGSPEEVERSRLEAEERAQLLRMSVLGEAPLQQQRHPELSV